MSTSAYVGKEFEAYGTETAIQAVYVHSDGYVDHTGKVLLEHYSDPNKVEDLVERGSVSFLGQEIGEKHSFYSHAVEHRNWTCFYHRDRGDEWESCHPLLVDTPEELQGNASYTYIFGVDGKWRVAKSTGYFISLEDAVSQALAEIEARK